MQSGLGLLGHRGPETSQPLGADIACMRLGMVACCHVAPFISLSNQHSTLKYSYSFHCMASREVCGILYQSIEITYEYTICLATLVPCNP